MDIAIANKRFHPPESFVQVAARFDVRVSTLHCWSMEPGKRDRDHGEGTGPVGCHEHPEDFAHHSASLTTRPVLYASEQRQ